MGQSSHQKKRVKAGTTKTKKKKKKIDSNVPRKHRTASSYMIWMNAEGRNQAKERHPEAKVTEVARLCGQTWHAMEATDKRKWEKMAEELKAVENKRYEAAVAAAPPRRKRPPSSYMLWMNEQGREYTKSQYPDLNATEIVSFCGQFWREMPPEQKKLWQLKAQELKEAYEAAKLEEAKTQAAATVTTTLPAKEE